MQAMYMLTRLLLIKIRNSCESVPCRRGMLQPRKPRCLASSVAAHHISFHWGTDLDLPRPTLVLAFKVLCRTLLPPLPGWSSLESDVVGWLSGIQRVWETALS